MKSESEINQQLKVMYAYLRHIEKDIPIGTGEWRATKRYIEALEWVLELE